MAICQFFLQGRCRFGDRCWNEHPGARGAGGGRQPPQQQLSGNNRRGWNTTSQRYSNVIQPSSFSKSTPWGGSRDQEKPSFGSFDLGASTNRNKGFGLSENPFASLSPEEQKDEKKLLVPSQGCSFSQASLDAGFENGKLLHKFKYLMLSLSDVKDGVNQAASAFGFGSSQAATFVSPGFPVNNSSSDNAQNFSFKTNSGFAAASSGSPAVLGSSPAFGAAASASSAISTSAPAFGFGKPEITSAASFSFKSPADSSFGSPGFSGLPTSLATGPISAPVPPAFGGGSSVAGFGSPGSHSHTAFSKPSTDTFGNSSISTSLSAPGSIIATDNVLFTPRDKLT
ncbi:Nucleoporin nup42, partial [Saguinus oedipus]